MTICSRCFYLPVAAFGYAAGWHCWCKNETIDEGRGLHQGVGGAAQDRVSVPGPSLDDRVRPYGDSSAGHDH